MSDGRSGVYRGMGVRGERRVGKGRRSGGVGGAESEGEEEVGMKGDGLHLGSLLLGEKVEA